MDASDAEQRALTEPGHAADVPTLMAEVVRLEHDLAVLAAAFDRLWFGEADTDDPRLVREVARLHAAISARLAQLEAVRAALRHAGVARLAAPDRPGATP